EARQAEAPGRVRAGCERQRAILQPVAVHRCAQPDPFAAKRRAVEFLSPLAPVRRRTRWQGGLPYQRRHIFALVEEARPAIDPAYRKQKGLASEQRRLPLERPRGEE